MAPHNTRVHTNVWNLTNVKCSSRNGRKMIVAVVVVVVVGSNQNQTRAKHKQKQAKNISNIIQVLQLGIVGSHALLATFAATW